MEMQPQTALLNKEQIRVFPPFQNLSPERIVILKTIEQCLTIQDELNQISIFGFDTESKPTFKVGEKSTGPHLIQLATLDKAYLFQVNDEILYFLKSILESEQQLKVGFGLKNDAHIFRAKGIVPQSLVDLAKCFASFGYRSQVGVQTAVALLFQTYLAKSKKVSTSNWAVKNLSPQQISYATADAYAALLIFQYLEQHQLLPTSMQQQISKIQHASASKT